METSPDTAATTDIPQVEDGNIADQEIVEVEPFSQEVVEQPALALLTEPVANIALPTNNDLDPAALAELAIRDLYTLARQHGIQPVKRKSKDQLTQELMTA